MKLENQVCDLKLAKKLKELGVKQDSLWFWQYHCVSGKYFLHSRKQVINSIYPYERYYSAFTVAELGEILPNDYYSNCASNIPEETIWHCSHIKKHTTQYQIAETEADARTKMLIYLLENQLKERSNQ